MNHPELREKDVAVLQAIQDGALTTSEIRDATTLSLREINYSLTEYSLEELGLVEINRSDGREWQDINGIERYIWNPKQVQLTDDGIQALTATEATESYEDLSKRELIEQIHELEDRIDRLESTFKDFRQKVMERL